VHVLARREGDDRQPLRRLGGHVLGRVHREVDPPVDDRRLELLREETLVADLRQRRVEDLVTLGVDDLDRDGQVRMEVLQTVAHPLALGERKPATPRTDAQDAAHAAPGSNSSRACAGPDPRAASCQGARVDAPGAS